MKLIKENVISQKKWVLNQRNTVCKMMIYYHGVHAVK